MQMYNPGEIVQQLGHKPKLVHVSVLTPSPKLVYVRSCRHQNQHLNATGHDGEAWGSGGWTELPQVVEVGANGVAGVAAPGGWRSPRLWHKEGHARLRVHRVVLQPAHGLCLCLPPPLQTVQPARRQQCALCWTVRLFEQSTQPV